MPKNQGTSRKGKPKKLDRDAGMGRALEKASQKRFRPKTNGSSRGAGMAASGATSIGIESNLDEEKKKRVSSILEVDELTDFLTQAELAQREFASEREQFIVLDSRTGVEYHHASSASSHVAQQQQPRRKAVRFADERTRGEDDAQDDSIVENEKDPLFRFQELSVPRRPKWDYDMDPKELDRLEKEAFLQWRRDIAKREEDIMLLNSHTTTSYTSPMGGPAQVKYTTAVTPFEKNIEIWRQLWRVLDRSQILIQIVDARNPLFYLSSDLRTYVEKEMNKPMIVLVNKSDFLTRKQRLAWKDYFQHTLQITPLFFSAFLEQKILDEHQQGHKDFSSDDDYDLLQEELDSEEEDIGEEKDDDSLDNPLLNDSDFVHDSHLDTSDNPETFHELVDGTNGDENNISSYNCQNDKQHSHEGDNTGADTLLSRDDLIHTLLDIAKHYEIEPSERYGNRIQFGMIGFPNVGKSSIINVLVGATKNTHNLVRVAVAAQPGKTKHFQTLNLPDREDMMLCDCPGLVFPSFVSSTADLIAAGVYPIAQMRDYWPVVDLICRRIPREVLNAHYAIKLSQPSYQDLKERGYVPPTDRGKLGATSGVFDDVTIQLPPPTAEELLGTYCLERSILSPSSGVPDYQRASRVVIKDYTEGKLLYCHPPPNCSLLTKNDSSSIITEDEFYLETLHSALMASKRVKERLTAKLNQLTVDKNDRKLVDPHDKNENGGENDEVSQQQRVDDLELFHVAVGTVTSCRLDGGVISRNEDEIDLEHFGTGSTSKSLVAKKWGKKNRKLRNKDPYGCHSSPDGAVIKNCAAGTFSSVPSHSGLFVNAGKKLGHQPYSRPHSGSNVRMTALSHSISK